MLGRTSNDWFKGAFILTIGALITKILSAVYRVPFQNIVGDIGFYIYQQVYPFYGFALVLSSYGFPVIISKHYTEIKEGGKTEKAQHFLILSFLFLSIIGICAFMALYFGSSWLAIHMNDPKLALLLKVISIVFLIFPILSVLRGYFQGAGNMFPTAFSQVGEQFIRVVTIIVVAILFTQKGLSLYLVGSGAAFGSITGGIVSIFLLVLFFLKENKARDWSTILTYPFFTDFLKISKLLLVEGFAVCISSMVILFIQLGDSLNMLALLVEKGIHLEAAKELKGVYDRGQPLVQFGSIVATSMSLSLVPAITSERIKQNHIEMQNKIRFTLQISTIIGVAAMIGLSAIIEPTNEMLFKNQEGSSILTALTPFILLSSLIITVISILQGLGIMIFPACVVLLCFALKYGLNYIFILKFGAAGGAIATNISIMIGLFLLGWKLKKKVQQPLITGQFLVKLTIASLLMWIVLKAYLFATQGGYELIESHRLVATFQSVTGVIIGAFIFLFAIMRFSLLSEEALAYIPFGKKLMFMLPKERRYETNAKKN